MATTSGTSVLHPLQSGRRKRKGINFKISESMLKLAKEMATRKKEDAPTPPPVTPAVEEPIPEPGPTRSLYRHVKLTAVICIGLDGFTLTNGVETIVWTGSTNHSHLAKELIEMKIRLLRTFDSLTYGHIMDLKESYEELKDLKILKPKQFEMYPCHYCKSEKCHRWNAAAAVARFHNIYFNPVSH